MSLISYVVEIGQIFRKRASVLTLLKNVLLLIPEPGRVDFTKILNDQAAWLDTLLSLAENAHTFGVNSKVLFVFGLDIHNSVD